MVTTSSPSLSMLISATTNQVHVSPPCAQRVACLEAKLEVQMRATDDAAAALEVHKRAADHAAAALAADKEGLRTKLAATLADADTHRRRSDQLEGKVQVSKASSCCGCSIPSCCLKQIM